MSTNGIFKDSNESVNTKIDANDIIGSFETNSEFVIKGSNQTMVSITKKKAIISLLATLCIGIIIGLIVGILYNVSDNKLMNANVDTTYSDNSVDIESVELTNTPKETNVMNSGYIAQWQDDKNPFVYENNMSKITIKDMNIKPYDGGYVIIFDCVYTNNASKAANLINDWNVKPMLYQAGIELNTPGITSVQDIFDYSDAFMDIKSGATIESQLVYILRDVENPIEVEFNTYRNKDIFSKFISIFVE